MDKHIALVAPEKPSLFLWNKKIHKKGCETKEKNSNDGRTK